MLSAGDPVADEIACYLLAYGFGDGESIKVGDFGHSHYEGRLPLCKIVKTPHVG